MIAQLVSSSEDHLVKKSPAPVALQRQAGRQRQAAGVRNGHGFPWSSKKKKKPHTTDIHFRERSRPPRSEQAVLQEIAQFLFHWNGDSFPSVPVERLFPFLLPPSLPLSLSLSPSLSSLMQVYFRWKSLGHSLPRLRSHWQTHCTTCPNSIINYQRRTTGPQVFPCRTTFGSRVELSVRGGYREGGQEPLQESKVVL